MNMRDKNSLLERAVLVERLIRDAKELSEIEKPFSALGLAATPEERWDINRFWLDRLPPVALRTMRAEALRSTENCLGK